MKQDPSKFRKHPEQFFKAQSKFFFEFIFFGIYHKRYLQDDHSKLFFCKKKFVRKKSPT